MLKLTLYILCFRNAAGELSPLYGPNVSWDACDNYRREKRLPSHTHVIVSVENCIPRGKYHVEGDTKS